MPEEAATVGVAPKVAPVDGAAFPKENEGVAPGLEAAGAAPNRLPDAGAAVVGAAPKENPDV